MALTEVADRSEVRRIKRNNHHEIVPFAAGSSNASRRIQPACIAMQQKRYHHARIKRRLAQPTHVAAHDLPEIQALPRHPNDKTRDVVLGHEVLHTRRQKQRLIDVPGAKVLAHSPSLNQTRWDLNSDYSDGLLEAFSKLKKSHSWPLEIKDGHHDDARRTIHRDHVGNGPRRRGASG